MKNLQAIELFVNVALNKTLKEWKWILIKEKH